MNKENAMKRIILALCGIAAVVAVLYPVVSEADPADELISGTEFTADGQRVRRYCRNLVPDPGFESGVSGFYAQGVNDMDPGPSEVMQTAVDPLEGSYSLRIDSRLPGQNFWWIYEYGGTGWHFGVSAHLRSDRESDSDLQFCAMAYYADGSVAQNCTLVTGDAGDKGVVSAALTLDSTKALASVRIRLYQEGLPNLHFTMDSAMACFPLVPRDIVTPLPPQVR